MRNHNKSINSSKVTRLLISWHQNRICGFLKKKKNCIRDTLFHLGHVLLFLKTFFCFSCLFAMLRRRPGPARAPDSKSQRQEVRFEGCMWRSGSVSSPACTPECTAAAALRSGAHENKGRNHICAIRDVCERLL